MRLKLLLIAFGGFFLLLLGMRPDSLPYANSEARYSDSITAHWPNALFLREAVFEQHEFPIWRETTMAGQPFAANPLNKTAYLFQWLALLFPPALFLNLMIILHLLIAGSGMWYWARSVGLRTEAVAFSACAYAFAPQVIGRIGAGHFDILYALAWWPWLMWAIKHFSESTDRKLTSILQVSLLAALVFLADTRTSLFALSVSAIYGIYCLRQHGKLRDVSRSLWVIPFFLILTVGLLIPLVLWQPYVTRAALRPSDAGIYSLEPIQFLGLILPSFQNVETQTYLGLPTLALAFFAVLSTSRRNQFLCLIAIVLIALYGLGLNSFVWPLLVKLIPALLWFRVPAKVWFILTLFAPVLAGYGLQWFMELVESNQTIIGVKQLNLLVTVTTFILLLVSIFALVALHLPSIITLFLSLALGGVLLAALNRRISSRWVFVISLGLLLIDLTYAGYQSAQWRSPAYWLDPYQALGERLAEDHPDRIYSPTYSIEQQVAEEYHLHLFGGVDPFQLSGIVNAITEGSGIPDTEYNPVVPSLQGIEDEKDVAQANIAAVINTRVLAQWKVSHIVSGHLLDDSRLQLIDTINGVYIYKNLDYTPRSLSAGIPDWPADWPGLPDSTRVQQFNQITILATAISGIGWIIVSAILTYLKMKRRPLIAKG